MSIRGRLLTLAIGGVLPLLIVGLAVLWIVWSEKRNQLNESIEQQAELVGVVFDRWLDSRGVWQWKLLCACACRRAR